MTALRKTDGGVRGIVVGDFFRRVVARTIAQQIAQSVEAVTSPFQGRDRVCQSHSPDIDGRQVNHPLSRWDRCIRQRVPQLDV